PTRERFASAQRDRRHSLGRASPSLHSALPHPSPGPTTPSPQLAGTQPFRQVSVSIELPSSHSSPGSTIPSPQLPASQMPASQLSPTSQAPPDEHGQPCEPIMQSPSLVPLEFESDSMIDGMQLPSTSVTVEARPSSSGPRAKFDTSAARARNVGEI